MAQNERPVEGAAPSRAARIAQAAMRGIAEKSVKVVDAAPIVVAEAQATSPTAKSKSPTKSKSNGSASPGSKATTSSVGELESQINDQPTKGPQSANRAVEQKKQVVAPVNVLPSVISEITALKEFKQAAKALQTSKKLTWQRCWSGATAPLAAALQLNRTADLLIVLPQVTELDRLAIDIATLLDQTAHVFPQGNDESQTETLLQQSALQRLQVLAGLSKKGRQEPRVVVTTLPAIMHGVPSPKDLDSGRRVLHIGQTIEVADLRTWLLQAGYVSTTAVQFAGELTVRGGILDVFPPDVADPIRIEWFDDQIESIRSFDNLSQRSIERLEKISIASTSPIEIESATLLDYLPANAIVCLYEPIQIRFTADAFLNRVPFPERFHDVDEIFERLAKFSNVHLVALTESDVEVESKPDDAPEDDPSDVEAVAVFDCPLKDVQRLTGDLEQLSNRINTALPGKKRAIVTCVNEPEIARMRELFGQNAAFQELRLQVQAGSLSHGFDLPDTGTMVLTVTQLLNRTTLPRSNRKASSRAIDSFLDLRGGDYVVHLSHGIGIYRGLEMIERLGQKQEHLEIEFAEGTKIFVPTAKIDLVQRYIGGTKSQPKLAKVGSQSWVKQKQAAQKAVIDMAAELLELQAQRRSHPGNALSSDTVWQSQFEGSFPYEETPDQIVAIAATKMDLMQPRPMDRLICGDVGFGKTEVAMRAAFKAVDNGYQVAVLVPTTVLAEQHYKTFRERMADFPFDIARLSRFCSSSEEKDIVRRISGGQIDIVIGTHRLASKDVQWYNLGLVIVDEEQRFGVAVKERLKTQRANVDLLTLSATPIPRTLHMSLLGVRDISNLETAPQERLSVQTKVTRFEDSIVRNAILRELNRGGQIFFVHNRVGDMHEVAARLQRLVPEASLVIGHGQMPEHQLERVMIDFIEHRYDILLATTIIESGLDIPNANTIFIDHADHYGLSELHQLRGRVGRYKHQAYCYLLIDKHKMLNPDAARRMHAIEEYSEIGAGFGIAMRDLEIRGAGNLLGTQQSGHIAAVGYEMYCSMLENAVRALKHQAPRLTIEVEVNLPVEAYISSEYVPEIRHKIDLYRRLSRTEHLQTIADLRQELLDRFGKVPTATERLFDMAKLRIDATLWSVRYIGLEDQFLVFTYGDHRRMEQLARRHNGRLKLLDRQRAYWSLEEETDDALIVASRILQP